MPFVTFRSLEQIRNNICHNNLNVKLVGGGGGLVIRYRVSHNTSEDLSVMRSLPNMSVYNPGSKIEAEIATQNYLIQMVRDLLDWEKPGR